MGFVQIIEYRTSKPEEVQALGEAYRDQRMAEAGTDDMGGVRIMATKDRDGDDVYLTIAYFPSYEAAMENSQREDTGEFAAAMGALCDGPPIFRNLDVLMEYGG